MTASETVRKSLISPPESPPITDRNLSIAKFISANSRMPATKGSQDKRYKVPLRQRPEPRTRQQHAIANCKILTLNDDCLRKVFSYLSVFDLCAVKDSCRRFNVLANSTVYQRWKRLTFIPGWSWFQSPRKVMIIQQHFGHLIENVEFLKQESTYPIQKRGFSKNWVQLKHFLALKRLTMNSANVNRLPIYQVKKTLQSLKVLKFNGCVGADSEFARIINACKNLKKLQSNRGPAISLLPSICHKFSQIESLVLVGDRCDRENRPVVNEIDLMSGLSHLQDMKKLKSLRIDCWGLAITSAIAPLARMKTLEYICLIDAKPDENLVEVFEKWPFVFVDTQYRTTSYEFSKHPTIIEID